MWSLFTALAFDTPVTAAVNTVIAVTPMAKTNTDCKMAVSKASQVANSKCRTQFAQVKEFFTEMHTIKKEALSREHEQAMRKLEILSQ